MNHHPSPTSLPAPSVELYEDVTGRRWQLVEDGDDGRLFVPESVDPRSCLRTFWLRESALTAFAGDLTRVERAA